MTTKQKAAAKPLDGTEQQAATDTQPVAGAELPATEEQDGKTIEQDGVYEPSDTVTEHNPYDTKVGGKPACTLADGTMPTTVKQTASKA